MSTLQKTSPKENIDTAIKSLRLAYDELQTIPESVKVSEHLHKAISFVESIITILPEKKEIEIQSSTKESSQKKAYIPKVFPIDELLAPIPGDNPAGKNSKLTGDFTILKNFFVNKARKPDFKPNYTEAFKKSQDILKTCGKDLGVSVLLIESAIQSHGFRAVTEGLILLNGLMSKYWDGLYPEAEDGDCEYRANEIENLQQTIILKLKARYGEAHEFTPHYKKREESEHENLVLETMLQEFTTLKIFINNHFGNEAPHLGELQKIITLYAKKVKEQYQLFLTADNTRTDLKISQQGRALDVLIGSEKNDKEEKSKGIGSFLFGGKKGKGDSKPENHEDALKQIIQCAQYLVSSFPNNPLGYHFNRGIRWFSEKRSPLNVYPGPEDKEKITALYSNKQWEDVLKIGEDVFMNDGDQWLDLQRFSCEAARNLGGKYLLIANIITMNTKSYVSNNRNILKMKFPDQSLIADKNTEAWILKEI